MRYFCIPGEDGEQSHKKVPAGKKPEDFGIDIAVAQETPRAPRPFEYWDGERFVLRASDQAMAERRARIERGDFADEMEARIEALEAALSRIAAAPK